MESDLAYFRRRASEERTAALQAKHLQVRKAHAQLAERYEDLVRALADSERLLEERIADQSPAH